MEKVNKKQDSKQFIVKYLIINYNATFKVKSKSSENSYKYNN